MKFFFKELWTFAYKQAWACIFGGSLLFLMLITHFYYPLENHLHRYDFLFISAVILQIIFLLTKLEEYKEAALIIVFHILATIMEIFKTSSSIGSWNYPGQAFIHIANVPLFAGFMYSAVGSYITRIWRVFDFKFIKYPPFWLTIIFSLAIYVNFFTHHYFWDFKLIIFLFILMAFFRTQVIFRVSSVDYSMPLLLGLMLVSLFIWLAENIATYCKVWLYPYQFTEWQMVSANKLLAWFLLMFVSFTLVAIVHHKELAEKK